MPKRTAPTPRAEYSPPKNTTRNPRPSAEDRNLGSPIAASARRESSSENPHPVRRAAPETPAEETLPKKVHRAVTTNPFVRQSCAAPLVNSQMKRPPKFRLFHVAPGGRRP